METKKNRKQMWQKSFLHSDVSNSTLCKTSCRKSYSFDCDRTVTHTLQASTRQQTNYFKKRVFHMIWLLCCFIFTTFLHLQ